MNHFHFRLNKVQAVRQNTREQRRLDLLEAQHAEDQIVAQITELQTALQSLRTHTRAATHPGYLDLDKLRHIQRYEYSLQGELRSAKTRHGSLVAEVQRCRQVLVEADREVKVLDRLQDRQQIQYRIDQARHEAKAMDDQTIMATMLS